MFCSGGSSCAHLMLYLVGFILSLCFSANPCYKDCYLLLLLLLLRLLILIDVILLVLPSEAAAAAAAAAQYD